MRSLSARTSAATLCTATARAASPARLTVTTESADGPEPVLVPAGADAGKAIKRLTGRWIKARPGDRRTEESLRYGKPIMVKRPTTK